MDAVSTGEAPPPSSVNETTSRPLSNSDIMKWTILAGLFFLCSTTAMSQTASVSSPNHRITIALYNQQNTDSGEWFLKVDYANNGRTSDAIPRIRLGLSRSDQDFSNDLRFLNSGKPTSILEHYSVLHGKRAQCINAASEVVVSFENPRKARLNVILRAYNVGVAFRY